MSIEIIDNGWSFYVREINYSSLKRESKLALIIDSFLSRLANKLEAINLERGLRFKEYIMSKENTGYDS